MIRNVEYGDRKKHQRTYLDGLKRYKNKGVRITIDGVECPEKEWEKIFEMGEDGGLLYGRLCWRRTGLSEGNQI